MSIIAKQAKNFIELNLNTRDNYENFINELRSKLLDYKKNSYKMEFLEVTLSHVKKEFDEHFEHCENRSNCRINTFCENTLFFIQQEVDELNDQVVNSEFSTTDKQNINRLIDKILSDLQTLKDGQQITYDDLVEELNELKQHYYLNKKSWNQLLLGKLTEIIANDVVSKEVSEPLIDILKKSYHDLIVDL